MRRFFILGATLALLLSGAVVAAAASPSAAPSTRSSASTAPSATTRPSAAPAAGSAAGSAAKGSATTAQTFSAQVQPVQIAGSATVTETNGGTGTVTLHITGLVDNQRWTVDIDGGTFAQPNDRVEIASKSGSQVTRLGTDTVRIHLTKTEMTAFLNARKSGGAVALVSDGMRTGYAEFAAA